MDWVKSLRAVILTAAVGLSISGVASARTAGARAGLGTVVVSHGLKITLSVAGTSYPRDGLARTHVTVQNVSTQTIGVVNSPCTGQYPQTLVLNRKGRAYPWPLPSYPLPCPMSMPTPLKPGKIMTDAPIVYLQSGNLVADVTVALGSSRFNYTDIRGDVLKIPLYTATPEQVVVAPKAGSTGGYVATLSPVPAHAGRLHFAELQSCRRARTGQLVGDVAGFWDTTKKSSISTTVFGPSCIHESWHLIAAWFGHPAVRVSFKASTG